MEDHPTSAAIAPQVSQVRPNSSAHTSPDYALKVQTPLENAVQDALRLPRIMRDRDHREEIQSNHRQQSTVGLYKSPAIPVGENLNLEERLRSALSVELGLYNTNDQAEMAAPPVAIQAAPDATRYTQGLIDRLLHAFICSLPPGRPSPFKQEIFPEATRPRKLATKKVLQRWTNSTSGQQFTHPEEVLAFAKPEKYLRACVYNANQKLFSVEGEVLLEGFCTLWTRKWPQNEEDKSPKRWYFSSEVTVVDGKDEHKILVRVPSKIEVVQDKETDLEELADIGPSWDDVVEALQEEVKRHVEGFPQLNLNGRGQTESLALICTTDKNRQSKPHGTAIKSQPQLISVCSAPLPISTAATVCSPTNSRIFGH